MSSKNGTKTPSRKCPVSYQTADQEDFAPRDFTTHGRPSNLDCPFAKFAQQGGLPETPESHDPIAAEFHQDQVSVNASTSASGPLGRCPIRFLDKHSPEEITAYFENHKHELPRSHQVCVQRYQRNEAQVKQLDARFGSLTNMIQGLGRSHKPYLPGDEKPVKQEASSSAAVEKWAETVSHPDSHLPKAEQNEHSEQRQSHFERPLREIRVGESPSRPWGISVPVTKDIPISAMNSDANQQATVHSSSTSPAPAMLNGVVDERPAGTRLEPPQMKPQAQAAPDLIAAATQPPTQIIFNGPVFFGYAPDDAAAFLKLLQNQASTEGRS